jgi:hypothetical protein
MRKAIAGSAQQLILCSSQHHISDLRWRGAVAAVKADYNIIIVGRIRVTLPAKELHSYFTTQCHN